MVWHGTETAILWQVPTMLRHRLSFLCALGVLLSFGIAHAQVRASKRPIKHRHKTMLKIYPRIEMAAMLRIASMPQAAIEERKKLFTSHLIGALLDTAEAKIRTIERHLIKAGKRAPAKRLAAERRRFLKIRKLVKRGAFAQASRQILSLRGRVLLALSPRKADLLGQLGDARALRILSARGGLADAVGPKKMKALDRSDPGSIIGPQFMVKLTGPNALIGEDGILPTKSVSALADSVARSGAKIRTSSGAAAKIRLHKAKLTGPSANVSLREIANATSGVTKALATVLGPTDLGTVSEVITLKETRGAVAPLDSRGIVAPCD